MVHFRAEFVDEVSVTHAKGQLTELMRRAEAGEEIVLTRHGKPAIRLVRVTSPQEVERRRRLLSEISRQGAVIATPAPMQPTALISLTMTKACRLIAVDTSALMAIILGEPTGPACIDALAENTELLMSAATLAERSSWADRRGAGHLMRSMIAGLPIGMIACTPETATRVADIYSRWGKGRHPAGWLDRLLRL